jgi:hypothetical protein
MTRTPDPRKVIVCPSCGKRLATVRRHWFVMRNLLVHYGHVTGTHTEPGIVTLICTCGTTTTVHWAAIQF